MSRTPTAEDIEAASDFDVASETPTQDASEQSPAPAAAVSSRVLPEQLPTDLAKALALLQKVQNMPQSNPTQEHARAKALARISPHVFALQQGLPVIDTDAGFLAKQHADSRRERIAIHMESLAHNDPTAREFLEIPAVREALKSLKVAPKKPAK